MKEQLQEISKFTGKLIGITFETLVAFLRAGITLIILCGALISFILLLKLYPEVFIDFIVSISPIVNLFMWIINFIFKFLIVAVIIYGLVCLAVIIYDWVKESRVRSEAKREKFLEDLAVKLNKKMKSKK